MRIAAGFLDSFQTNEILSFKYFSGNVTGITMSPFLGCGTSRCNGRHLDGLHPDPFRCSAELAPSLTIERIFGGCVVVAIAPTTHADLEVVRIDERLPIEAAVLATLIRMNVVLLIALSSPYRHQ